MAKLNKKIYKSICVKNNCQTVVNTKLCKIMVAPFDELPTDAQRLLSYFLHKAPDISSVHSMKIIPGLHAELFRQMVESRHFYYQKFCWFNAPIKKELEKGHLYGDELCLKCKRFVCKKEKRNKEQSQETELDCFLRHIRNAIAHGRVFYLHAGNRVHFVFEDVNKSKNISARIICIKADLMHWKKVLDNPKNYL